MVTRLVLTLTFQIVLLLLHINLSEPKTVEETLIFSPGKISPDNYPVDGILTNGQFPGPTITATKNDYLILTVENRLPGNFSLHSHGILQKGSVESDGVPFVTQDPQPPNTTLTYTMHLGNQSGTFIYHAHTELDLVWAFGALIIESGVEHLDTRYDEEKLIILSQCWHEPLPEILDGLLGAPFADVPDTASVLINGRSWGEFNHSNIEEMLQENDSAVSSTGYEVINVEQGKTYRFRVIGLGMDSMLTFSIENHTVEIIEVDGISTDSVVTDTLQINSAQRYSVIVKMDQPIGNYWIKSEMIPGPGPNNGKAILHYNGAGSPELMRTQLFPGESSELELTNWVLEELHPSTNETQEAVYPVPKTVDREIVIRSLQRVVNNYTKFDINQKFHKHEGPTLLRQLEAGNDIMCNEANGVYEILTGENVQVVFENTMSDEGECEQHPWHTHGHTFYVVGQGSDSYDSSVDGKEIDERLAKSSGRELAFRDVVTLFPSQTVENTTTGAPCGWVAIRFVADNPGLWLVHCHLTPHQIMVRFS